MFKPGFAIFLLGLALAAVFSPQAAQAGDSAVVVMYHRFGEGKYPSTNIRLEQFEEHLRELQEGGYTVLPLPEIISALKEKKPLPDRAVGISIDDAYLSVYREAWPRLKAAGYPFTLFVATDEIDEKAQGHMSWEQLREMAKAGVTIGSQTAAHPHMPDIAPGAMDAELAKSNARFKAELGKAPDLFAYPYGEANRAAMESARKAGFVAAFGQHSGVSWTGGDFYYLPRFAFNESYGSSDRFRTAARALALPATDVIPADPTIGAEPVMFGFSIAEDVGSLAPLACYSSHEPKPHLERIGNRVEVRFATPFPKGRGRINCTLPGPNQRWRWFGYQVYRP